MEFISFKKSFIIVQEKIKELYIMNTSEVIRARRSIRKYEENFIIPQKDIEIILEAAMMAPSACNTRPWEFVVVENSIIKEQIMEISPYTSMLRTASLAIVVCGKPDLQKAIGSSFWPQDCGAAIENLLLQATDLGYGTCWCGFYPVMERVEALQKVLHVSSIPMAVIAVGKPAENPEARGFFDSSKVTYLK